MTLVTASRLSAIESAMPGAIAGDDGGCGGVDAGGKVGAGDSGGGDDGDGGGGNGGIDGAVTKAISPTGALADSTVTCSREVASTGSSEKVRILACRVVCSVAVVATMLALTRTDAALT